jgi:hypothetical protein
MRFPNISLSHVATLCALALAASNSIAQSNQEWMSIKAKCGLNSSLAYNDWVAQGAPCSSAASAKTTAVPALPTTQQQTAMAIGQLGANMIGQGLHQLFFGQPVDPVLQQRSVAADQLNKSGIYLFNQRDYPGALNEFQKALALTPGNVNISHNVTLALQRITEQAEAAKRSQALGTVLGSAGQGTGNPFNVPSIAMPLNSPDAVRLSRNLGGDGSVLLQGSTPVSLKEQIDAVWGKPSAEPPDPRLQLPEAKDIELLFDPPGPASATIPSNPAQPSPSAIDAVFQQSGVDDYMEQKIMQDAISGIDVPASSNATAKPGPHN